MKSYILTGTPGAGKTSIIQALKAQGHVCIPEAATDIIHLAQAKGDQEPWLHGTFIDQITTVQAQRQQEAELLQGPFRFYDRSPICTLALARFLQLPLPKILLSELQRIQEDKVYEKSVFFIENLGFIENTDARRISFEEALRFEKLHKEVYQELGYLLISVPRGPIEVRTSFILSQIKGAS